MPSANKYNIMESDDERARRRVKNIEKIARF